MTPTAAGIGIIISGGISFALSFALSQGTKQFNKFPIIYINLIASFGIQIVSFIIAYFLQT